MTAGAKVCQINFVILKIYNKFIRYYNHFYAGNNSGKSQDSFVSQK